MERAEVDGACGWEWSSAKAQKPEWIRDGKLNFLLQIGPHANDELTKMGVPRLGNTSRTTTAAGSWN